MHAANLVIDEIMEIPVAPVTVLPEYFIEQPVRFRLPLSLIVHLRLHIHERVEVLFHAFFPDDGLRHLCMTGTGAPFEAAPIINIRTGTGTMQALRAFNE